MFFCACSQKTGTTEKTNNGEPTVGGDKDEHGCIASAGYTWSELKGECLRIWENGVQLQPLENDKSYTANATVIFNDDQSRAELFLPESPPQILERTGQEGGYVWKKGDIEFFAWKGYVLRINGKPVYHGE